MFDITLRQWKDILADPVASMVPGWLSPDHVTLLAFAFGLSSCFMAAAADSCSTLALAFWATNRFLDCVDGALARKRKVVSELGGFLDLLGDFIVYSVLPIAIAYGQDRGADDRGTKWVAVSILEASFHVNNFILFYSAAVAAQKDDRELTSVTMLPALIEGFESGVLFTAMLLWPQYITALCWIMGLGVAVGICQRTIAVASVLGGRRASNLTKREERN